MGKNIISQRRGRGTTTYRMPPYHFMPRLVYRNDAGRVLDIVPDPRRDAPLAKVQYADKGVSYIIAPQGIKVGDETGPYIMPLSAIPEGTTISCLEISPNSGPKLCRSPGSGAILMSKGKDCIVELPSKKTISLHPACRAMIGLPAGEGRNEKPFMKAGNRHHLTRARGKLYPRTSGVAMNAVSHPFGGSGTGKVRPPAGRTAPPGRKVGLIAARRSGRKR